MSVCLYLFLGVVHTWSSVCLPLPLPGCRRVGRILVNSLGSGRLDRQDSLEVLRDKDNWVIWKTKDDKWTHELRQAGFHQLLALDKTPERVAGAIKSRDGGAGAISKARSEKKLGNAG